MLRFWRLAVLTGTAVAVGVLWLMPSSGAQIPPPPTLPPGFTFPSFSVPTLPPPTMPPFTTPPFTTPPPTMAPPTTTPPPTMPPFTVQPPSLPSDIDGLIDEAVSDLEEFGNEFQDLINALRALQGAR